MAEKDSDKNNEKGDFQEKFSEIQSADSKQIIQPGSGEYQNALAANPDYFPSMADLPALGPKGEPFQIHDGDKTIAASRKVSHDQAGNPSFHEGLRALPASATEEEIAQAQIDYINRKVDEQVKPSSLKLFGYVSNVPEVTGPIQSAQDAGRFLNSMFQTWKQGGMGLLKHLSEPNAVNNDIKNGITFLSQDNTEMNHQLLLSGEAILDDLSRPMEPEERGAMTASLSLWFIFKGKKQASQAEVVEHTGVPIEHLKALEPHEQWMRHGVQLVEKEYRAAFLEAYPKCAEIEGGIQVHHLIPQQALIRAPGAFTPIEIHSLDNLVGIKNVGRVHNKVTHQWNKFWDSCKGRYPTRQEILTEAERINDIYKEHYLRGD